MTVETPLPGAEDARPRRQPGFAPGSTVDVRQVSDQDWETLRTLTYYATDEDFEVPLHKRTDFASVPRTFVWFIPRYGRYTKAAILHDYLCSVEVRDGRIDRIDADGIFRQAMRELGVPFLRRWIMWAAVRLGALTTPAGRKRWWAEAWRVALVAAVALPIVAPAAVVIVLTLPVFYLVELLAWIPLKVVHGIRENRHQPAKTVNRPTLRWKL
ncbi:MAG TPA: DUF1353 domain-containing protein [Streptosporangiaceae bacterium]